MNTAKRKEFCWTKLQMHKVFFQFAGKLLLFENFDSPRYKPKKAMFQKCIHSLNQTLSKTFIKRENKTFLERFFCSNSKFLWYWNKSGKIVHIFFQFRIHYCMPTFVSSFSNKRTKWNDEKFLIIQMMIKINTKKELDIQSFKLTLFIYFTFFS